MSENSNTLWARAIIAELVRSGVTTFCISPGSRSTPLTAAVAANPDARANICYDERGSAFYALGYARAYDRPAAVITTSGTAAANLLPAVTEASVDKVPLLLLTADRPPELTDTGANQTLNQAAMFGQFTRWRFDLPCPCDEVGVEMALTTVDQAIYRCGGTHPGPVHLNCRFREPLEPDQSQQHWPEKLARWAQSSEPYTRYERPVLGAGPEVVESLAADIAKVQKGMVVLGRLRPADRKPALELIEKLNWPVYADITSGLRLRGCGTNVIRHFDQLLLSERFNAKASPQFVLHLGGRTTSKRVGLFFDRNRPADYVVVKADPDRYDPIHAVTTHIQADVASFCSALASKVAARQVNEFTEFYRVHADAAQEIIESNIAAESKLSELFVARDISRAIPDGSGLFVSNSMPIRDMDLYSKTADKNIEIGANRGISGIDGIIASACGFSEGLARPVTVVMGDLAFIHDVNSLSIISRLKAPVTVVVINNHGGGIFDFLPISRNTDIFEDFFITPHDFTFAGVCETFVIDYHKATSTAEFSDFYRRCAASGGPAVIEVATDRTVNLRLRKAIKKAIIEKLEGPNTGD